MTQQEAGGTPDSTPVMAPTRRGRHRENVHEVVFVAYPKLLFIWPVLLCGYLFWPLQAWGWADPEVLGWIYLFTVTFVVMTLGVDVNRNQAIFWIVFVGLVWFLGLWLRDVQGFTGFGNIYRWFAGLNVTYDKSFGLTLSILLSVPYLLMILYARLNDRWRITHNEFEHYSLGRMDDSLGRGAKTIRTSFPDVFEMILGLAGTLVVFNATGTRELRQIPHVMFLPFIRKRLNRILERTAVTSAMMDADDEEDDEV